MSSAPNGVPPREGNGLRPKGLGATPAESPGQRRLDEMIDEAANKAAWCLENGATNENADVCRAIIRYREVCIALNSHGLARTPSTPTGGPIPQSLPADALPAPPTIEGEALRALERLVEATAPEWDRGFRCCGACLGAVGEDAVGRDRSEEIKHTDDCAWIAARRALGCSPEEGK